jgi:adenylylsulfate kinase-like enzyme
VASWLEHHGVTSLVSLVSRYRASREFVRGLCQRFIKGHVSTPLAECQRRDPKGLYRLAWTGGVVHLTGVTDLYEASDAPEYRIDTAATPLDVAVPLVLEGLLPAPTVATRQGALAP